MRARPCSAALLSMLGDVARCDNDAEENSADFAVGTNAASAAKRTPLPLDAYQAAVDVDGLCGHEGSVFACQK